MAVLDTKVFFLLQDSFSVPSSFFLGLNLVTCTNLHVLLLLYPFPHITWTPTRVTLLC